MLLLIAFDVRTYTGVPDYKATVVDHFVPIVRRLQEKGLITHDLNRDPTFVCTEQGMALAKLIVEDAKKILTITQGHKKRQRLWKPKAQKKNLWPRYEETEYANLMEGIER